MLAKRIALFLMLLASTSAASAEAGLETVRSAHSFTATVTRLESSLATKGITVFAKIDHANEAKKVGLSLPPTVLFVVGNPKVGTGIMQKSPTAAIDLPLKMLISENEPGKVLITVNTANHLMQRHMISEEASRALGSVGQIAREVASQP